MTETARIAGRRVIGLSKFGVIPGGGEPAGMTASNSGDSDSMKATVIPPSDILTSW